MGKKAKGAMPPAFAACDTDDVEELRALIASAGAQKVVTEKNKDGWTPLHQAAFAGAVDCVGALLEHGADVLAKCSDGDTPAHYASAQGHVDVVELLLAKAGARLFAVRDEDGESVIDVALNAKTKRALEALETRAANAAEDEEEEGGDDDGEGDDDDDDGGEGGAK